MENVAVNAQEKDALAQLRESTLKEQFVRGVLDISVRRELRKLLLGQADLSFTDLREFALELFPDAEQFCEERSSVDCNTALAYKAAAAPSDSKVSDLLESQKRLVDTMQKLVEQQTSMTTKMQSMSEGIESLVAAQRRSQIKCTFCHRTGHTTENCFKRKRLENKKANEQADKPQETEKPGNVNPPPQRAL